MNYYNVDVSCFVCAVIVKKRASQRVENSVPWKDAHGMVVHISMVKPNHPHINEEELSLFFFHCFFLCGTGTYLKKLFLFIFLSVCMSSRVVSHYIHRFFLFSNKYIFSLTIQSNLNK